MTNGSTEQHRTLIRVLLQPKQVTLRLAKASYRIMSKHTCGIILLWLMGTPWEARTGAR